MPMSAQLVVLVKKGTLKPRGRSTLLSAHRAMSVGKGRAYHRVPRRLWSRRVVSCVCVWSDSHSRTLEFDTAPKRSRCVAKVHCPSQPEGHEVSAGPHRMTCLSVA